MSLTLVMFAMFASWWNAATPPPVVSPFVVGATATTAADAGPVCVASGPGSGGQIFDRGANALLRTTVEPGRQVAMDGRSDDLEFKHVVTIDGGVNIRLARGADVVELAIEASRIQIRRGDRTIIVGQSTATEADFLAVEALLAGSPAVRRFRGVASSLEPATWRTPAGVGVQLADVLVGLLQGEVGASDRLVNRMKLMRRPVRLARQDSGCFEDYESEIFRAYNDFLMCCVEAWAWRDACNWRFILWAETAWFHMLGCAAIPIHGD